MDRSIKKKTKHCTHLHAYSPQELKQRLGPVFCVLFALFKAVAFVHQRLDLAKLERAYSFTSFDHPLPDATGIHGGHQYHVTFLNGKHKKRFSCFERHKGFEGSSYVKFQRVFVIRVRAAVGHGTCQRQHLYFLRPVARSR